MTITFPASPAPADMVPLSLPEEPVVRLSVEGYHALLKAGVLQSGDPIELLEGFMVPKMTRGPRHESVRRRLRRMLEQMISAEFFVDEQGAFTSTDSEPEPDVYVIRGDIDDYATRHARPDELPLVIEIADTSLHRDRNWKKRIYARAGIACYWVVNLVDGCVEVFAKPSGDVSSPDYSNPQAYGPGDEVPVVIDGQEIGRISVTQLLA
jgi:Uma2 family endonuclease